MTKVWLVFRFDINGLLVHDSTFYSKDDAEIYAIRKGNLVVIEAEASS